MPGVPSRGRVPDKPPEPFIPLVVDDVTEILAPWPAAKNASAEDFKAQYMQEPAPMPPAAMPYSSVAIADDPAWLREVGIWVLADGQRKRLSKMTASHLGSSINYLGKVIAEDAGFQFTSPDHRMRCEEKRKELMYERERRKDVKW